MKKSPFVLIAAIALLCIGSGTPEFFNQKLTEYIISERPEKVYLHTDKPYYGTGETIWFKAYLRDAILHRPIAASSVLYVELIDPAGKIIDERVLKVVDGDANAEFKLDRKLATGNYQLRSYTHWMRNSDPDFMFKRSIRVVNPEEPIEDASKVSSQEVLLDFFPEGGDLVAGIPTKVAFKATDVRGKGIDVTGKIFNTGGQEVATFGVGKFGMGVFILNPLEGERYYAKLSDDSVVELPVVKSAGAVMKVHHSFGGRVVTISVNSQNLDLEGGSLVVHQRGKLLAAIEHKDSGHFVQLIDRSTLPTGICHLTFFDKENKPLTERLIFVNLPKKSDLLDVQTDKPVYKRRSLVKMSYSGADSTAFSASMTITPKNEVKYHKYGENIVNHFLLNSELVGRIEFPEFYFEDTRESNNALDILMLTQGWRRFNWADVLGDEKEPLEYFAEEGLTIEGRVVDYFNKSKPRSGTISLITYKNGFQMHEGVTRENGHFAITGAQFMDTTEVLLKARRVKGKKEKQDDYVSIILKKREKPEVILMPDTVTIIADFSEKVKKLLQISDAYNLEPGTILLDEFTVVGRRESSGPYSVSDEYYGMPDNRVIADSVAWAVSATSAFDFLRGMAGVRVVGTFPNQSVVIRGASNQTDTLGGAIPGQGGTVYLLDGMPVNVDVISSVSAENILFVDVLKGVNAMMQGASGVVAVYTRQGNGFDAVTAEAKGLLSFEHPGYNQGREFYSPRYDVKKEEHIIPDYRSTIYWNPSLSHSESSLDFYTSDQRGEFQVRIEGMTATGKPIFQTSTFTVE